MKVTFEENYAIMENGEKMNENEFFAKYTQCDICKEWFLDEETETLWDKHMNRKYVCKKDIPEGAVKCSQCGDYYADKEDMCFYEGKWYCEGCARDNDLEKCESCGNWFKTYNGVFCSDDDSWYCNSCAEDEEIERCYSCDGYFHRSRMTYASDVEEHFCEECANNYLCRCDNCGRYMYYEDSLRYSEDADSWYCEDCYSESLGPIDEYHTFKDYGDYNFHCTAEQSLDKNEYKRREKNLHLGFELEIDKGSDRCKDVASDLNIIFDGFCHFEHDCSLDNGFEIISHPATIDWLIENREMIEKAMRRCVSGGYKSHDASTCGLHVHVDKEFFGEKINMSAAKIVYIFEKFWDNFVIFSRRKSCDIDRWAKKYNAPISHVIEDYMGSQDHSDRYYAVNLTNDNTIEFRIARGTLKPSTFFATLKFYDRICHIAKEKTALEIAKMSWEDLLGDDAEITAYWKERADRINGSVSDDCENQ